MLKLREARPDGQLLALGGVGRLRQLLRVELSEVHRGLQQQRKLLRVLALGRRRIRPLQVVQDHLVFALLCRVHAPAQPQRPWRLLATSARAQIQHRSRGAIRHP